MERMKEYETRRVFANNLAYLRKSRDYRLSQAALARILNLSEYTINNYEQCRAAPSAYVVMTVASYFGCTMEELITQNLSRRKD